MTPPSKPKASVTAVLAAAIKACDPLPEMFVLVVRGYYRDSMGKPGVNDVGVYDDAIFIVSPSGFSAWNGNSDPSRYGWNPSADKYMARLKPGVYQFRRLKHHPSRPNGYMAFGQGDSPVVVERIKQDGSIAKTETGCFGINLHRGGINGTSSEGCLTVPRAQWAAFDSCLAGIVKKKPFTLILVEGPIA